MMNSFFKTGLHCVIAFTLCAAGSFATFADQPATGQSRDVLLKDSFEKGDRAPNGWKSGAAIPGVRYVYERRQGATGKRSLSLQKSAKRYFPIAQWVRVLPNRSKLPALRVTAMVKAQGATKAIVDVSFLDARGRSTGHKWVSYIGAKNSGDAPANHDWKEYSGVVPVPTGTKKIALALQIYGPGKVWFDDLEATWVKSADDEPTNETAAAVPAEAIEVTVGRSTGHYLFVGPKTREAPQGSGYGLLVVLPGGAGTADFHPFVKRIHQYALPNEFLLAQPLATKWTDDQVLVWPTATNKVDQMKFTTEELIGAVIDSVATNYRIDPRRVYLLAWSSGGPAAYATLLGKQSPAAGGLIAMSVFKPNYLPPVENAKGRSFYLLHSPDDRVAPYRMARAGQQALQAASAQVTLVDYSGGHGWRGDVYGNVRRGIQWLQARSD